LKVPTLFLAACELKNNLPAFARGLLARASARQAAMLVASLLVCSPVMASAAARQEHPPATVPSQQQGAAEHAEQEAHEEGEAHHDESLAGMIKAMGWPVANFIIFIGVLYYFLNQPLKDYLANRDATIRKDLVEAAALRATATTQLATIEQKLQALPGELNALRTRGAEEIAAEEQRIAAQAAADRDRLLEQTRREIDLQVRLAKKEILEHAADLSVALATDRIRKEMTPADQERLVDRYLSQVKEQR
jgi:F-type H+-transporting ATPase subunit b